MRSPAWAFVGVRIPVRYHGRHGWGHPGNANNRPYAELIFPAAPRSRRLWALVDSGADYLQLPSQFAQRIGVNVSTHGKAVSMAVAGGGTVQFIRVPSVPVQIEGKLVRVDCLFSPNQAATPLLGRTAFLAAIDVGIDVNGWLYKL